MKKIILLLLVVLITQQIVGQTSSTIDLATLLGKKEIVKSSKNYTLAPQVAKAFKAMKAEAKKENIELKIVSSFRSYNAQKRIWNRKYKLFTSRGLTGPEAVAKIIEYSTLPGTSRHHWGTDIDIIEGSKNIKGDILNEIHFNNGAYQKLRQWLENNAHCFGFDIVYTKDSLRKGFLYEPWHYSYTPLSIKYLKTYIEEELIFTIGKDSTLLGHKFITHEFLKEYYQNNVMGINSRLLQYTLF